jgi:hypothetical protein
MRRFAAVAFLMTVCACSKEEAAPPAPVASASATPPAPPPPPIATAKAAPEPEPHHDCPSNSSGTGSFGAPCDAKGATRLMTVKWKKTDDKGPSFSIKNVGKATIVYGRIAVYFYDKSGKQIESLDDSDTPGKKLPYHSCAGNFFQGVMKPAESAILTFSCVPKSVIPDGTATIESEMQMVGFADPTEKKIDFYWRNMDLTPSARPKGGVK